jgi:hypothetical protein
MRRISLLVLVMSMLLLAAGCGQFGKQYTGSAKAKASAANEQKVTTKPFDEAAAKAAGCDGTKATEFESEGRGHTTDIKTPVTYKHNPPHSGEHYQVPADWGFYDKQQPDVQTVHNLEHGHIVITWKGLSKDDQKLLHDAWDKNQYHLLVEPRDKTPKAGVYYTAWAVQLYCKHPSKEALQYMIDNYRDQGPELFTTDTGGGNMGAGKNTS